MLKISIITLTLLATVEQARPCAAAAVTTENATIGADAQRIFVSVRESETVVVTQVNIPETTEPFALLIPVPAMPTLREEPIDSNDLDILAENTTPKTILSSGGGGGIGCGSAADSSPENSVNVGQQAQIGPLDAVVLSAGSSQDLTDWLDANGYELPENTDSVIAPYVGQDKYFIALKKRDNLRTSETSNTSLGVLFTLPGQFWGVPLPVARIGGGPSVAFTILFGADKQVQPTNDYDRILLKDLDIDKVREAGYVAAVRTATSDTGGKAFVVEGTYDTSSGAFAVLPEVFPSGQTVTRLSAIMNTSDLTTDVVFEENDDGPQSNTLNITKVEEDEGGCTSGALSGTLALVLAAMLLLLPRKRRQN